MAYSFSLKELRLALGLSQDQMAGLLQLERGQLSMAELSLRSPGGKVLLRLHTLSDLLSHVSETPTAPPTDSIPDWLEKLGRERTRLRHRLEKLKSQQQASAFRTAVVSNPEAWQDPNFNPEKDRLWSAMMEAALPDPSEMAKKTFRLSTELETLEWKINRLKAQRANL